MTVLLKYIFPKRFMHVVQKFCVPFSATVSITLVPKSMWLYRLNHYFMLLNNIEALFFTKYRHYFRCSGVAVVHSTCFMLSTNPMPPRTFTMQGNST